ncbi:MAG TPA: metallophosphoesterase [Chitinophagaceae bacterium]|nr:metallophosphoesterase [Chitinophagaceae bacterium]
MRNSIFWWVLIGFMVLLDFYFFQAIKLITQGTTSKVRSVIFISYWTISVSAILLLLLLPYLHFEHQNRVFRNSVFACIAGLFFAKLVASVFFLVDDVRRVIQWGAGKIYFSNTEGELFQSGERISRSAFLSWAGMLVGGGLFGSLIYGFGNKYNYQLTKLQLAFQNLPSSFKGLKIAHISDIHAGSFTDKEAVKKGVQKIMNQKPDLVLFTGDLVNNTAGEIDEYIDIFKEIKAPLGVYSVFGNHDYGDYFQWNNPEEKIKNLEILKQKHASLGWRLMLDENILLEKEGEKIALIGVQNISGKSRFRSYGDLPKAYNGLEKSHFKILLSHDPSHWDTEVRENYPDIDLMLSGHTHGMQFGVEIPGFKWSPVQYVYKQWAGLYQEGSQKLYVNRGFGFIGYPGRVGILPEISMIELV